MSVTTSRRDGVSLEIRSSAQHGQEGQNSEEGASGARNPVSASIPAHTQQLRLLKRTLSVAPPLALAVILLVSWYLSTTYGQVNSLILPAPGDVLNSLTNGLSNGLFLNSALVTIQESLSGFLLALAVALPLGYGLAKSRFMAASIQPYFAAGQAIPAIVIAPLLVLWLGYGLVPIMIVCMLVVLFPMVINTILGVQTIDRSIIDAARVDGATGRSMLAFIEFPLALPAILAGVRTGLTLSITGALVAEFVIGGDQGLGSLVLLAKDQFDTAFLFAILIVLGVLAFVYYSASWLLVKLAQAIY
jgi:NitT/TauT family transport system permease protein